MTVYLLLFDGPASVTRLRKNLHKVLWYKGGPWIWAPLHLKQVQSLGQCRIFIANKFSESTG